MSSDLSADAEPVAAKEPDAKKPSGEILRQEIREGVTALEIPSKNLFISGLSAGLDVGFSPFFMALLQTSIDADHGGALAKLLVANAYALGFIFVVLGRSELFTEQTTLAVLPVLSGRASLASLARLWSIVYVSNLLGAAGFALLAVHAGPKLQVIDPRAFLEIAEPLVFRSWDTTLLSAVLAGWLMGLLSWLVASARDTISQIVIVWLIAAAIGIGRLSHVVVGGAEVMMAMFSSEQVTAADFGHFLLWTTLGNILGGSFFVALLKYSHAARSMRLEQHRRR